MREKILLRTVAYSSRREFFVNATRQPNRRRKNLFHEKFLTDLESRETRDQPGASGTSRETESFAEKWYRLAAKLICAFMHRSRDHAEAARRSSCCPKRTETSLETPGSCMVTPYITGAMLMVRLLWVMSTNCVCTLISR